jgi:hypothetical protein
MTIRLRNHFCFGAFEVELSVDDPDAADLTLYDYIAGVDARDLRLYGRSGRASEQHPGPACISLGVPSAQTSLARILQQGERPDLGRGA